MANAATIDRPATSRHALLSHCLANQNAKVDEYALCPGPVRPVLGVLRAFGYRLHQMPCPEMGFLGANRWWQVREQYDTPGYRRHCRGLAKIVVSGIAESLREPCADFVLIGVEGSGSSAVKLTGIGPTWGGRPEEIPWQVVEGKGIWIQELEAEMIASGLPQPRAWGFPGELPGFRIEEAVNSLRTFLELGGNAPD
jgi:predicted secreted protein